MFKDGAWSRGRVSVCGVRCRDVFARLWLIAAVAEPSLTFPQWLKETYPMRSDQAAPVQNIARPQSTWPKAFRGSSGGASFSPISDLWEAFWHHRRIGGSEAWLRVWLSVRRWVKTDPESRGGAFIWGNRKCLTVKTGSIVHVFSM